MIEVQGVSKRYRTGHGLGPWVLREVDLVIPPRTNVGVVGRNGAGKSTLLRLMAGIDQPTRGRVRRQCRVSWPMGFAGGLQGTLTGRQNARFICRLHGEEGQEDRVIERVQDFAELGAFFDEPVKTYSTGMKARLQFALSLAFRFDVYISDEVTAAGDTAFHAKAVRAFEQMVDRAGLVMVSHSRSTLLKFCTAGIWLHQGRAHWFDRIEDALGAYEGEAQA